MDDEKMRKVILLIDCASEFDRRLLRGMVKYSKERGPWLFYRMPMNLREHTDGGLNVINWAKKWGADAIVGRWRSNDTDILATLNMPVVLQNYSSRSSIFSNLTGDYVGTGMLAAKFFSNRKFMDFAYFGVKNVVWSEERLQGFREEIERQNGKLHVLMVDEAYSESERGRIVQWLHALPKPIALFTCDDAHALFLTETCKVENIGIPTEISLLGVDNDELLCHISDPPISSIALNVEQGGFRTCEMLDKQFSSNDFWSFNVIINPGEIVQRDSTKKYNIKDPHIDRIVRYINDNFDQYITTETVISQVPLSRRSVEIRFKKEMGNVTLYKYLTKCRMDHYAHLLATTDLSITEIADMCGILNDLNISRTFRKQFGCTPKEYRRLKKKEQNL